MQTRKADRIIAGQNDAERKSRGGTMILSGHDSVVSGCGFAALRSLRLTNCRIQVKSVSVKSASGDEWQRAYLAAGLFSGFLVEASGATIGASPGSFGFNLSSRISTPASFLRLAM
jgi:hypothetical protein